MAKLNWYKTGKENRISKQGYDFLKSDPLPTQPDNIVKPKKKKSSKITKQNSQYIYQPAKKKKNNLKTCPICGKKFVVLSKHVHKCILEYQKTKNSKNKSKAKKETKIKSTVIVQEGNNGVKGLKDRRISSAFLSSIKNKKQLKGYVIKENKGGFVVMFNGVRGFCPKSQMYQSNTKVSYNKSKRLLNFHIIEASEYNLIVSRKLAIRENTLRFLRKAMKQNDTLTVKVKNIQSYGVFVNYGLVDGFIHISKLSPKKIDDINKFVRIHQRLNVKVLEIQNDDRVAFTMV